MTKFTEDGELAPIFKKDDEIVQKTNEPEFKNIAINSETKTTLSEFNLMFLNNGVVLTNPHRDNIVSLTYEGANELMKLLQENLKDDEV